jgi:hypothetical protein
MKLFSQVIIVEYAIKFLLDEQSSLKNVVEPD